MNLDYLSLPERAGVIPLESVLPMEERDRSGRSQGAHFTVWSMCSARNLTGVDRQKAASRPATRRACHAVIHGQPVVCG
eukprot:5725223-Amphidinium_carterae.1